MRPALMRLHSGWSSLDRRFRASVRSKAARLAGLGRGPKLALGGFLLAVPAFGLWAQPAAADIASGFMNIGGAFGSYVVIIVNMLVMAAVTLELAIAVMLTKLLIAVCGYQGFVTSDAVATGWPLIRDLCNMFFIVVLLIIAFSTIIGYKEFDYKRYVPRLLLMAVLINFSKTLIGVLIDFSQVIMLTFVNGFKEAAFGNFAKAFGLSNILSMSYDAMKGVNVNTGMENYADAIGLLISSIFASIMLMVVCTILTMMLVYMVARVISLWILLIFAPLAFFVWALPPKMSKHLPAVAGQYWQQLGSWLAGGPILAFFLWLTMAIVASKPNPFARLMVVDQESSVVMKVLNRAAESGNLANFIVATALLFLGLKQALEISKQAGGMVGSAMQKIQSTGGPVGLAGGLAARGAGKAAGFVAKRADQKYGVTAGLGKGLMGKAGEWGQKGGLRGMLAMPLASVGAKVGGVAAGREREAAEKLGKTTKYLPPEQYEQAMSAAKASGDKSTRAAAKKDEMLRRFDPSYRGAIVARDKAAAVEAWKRNNPNAKTAELEEESRAAELRANRAYDANTGKMMNDLKDDKDVGDDGEFRKKLREEMGKNPHLAADLSGMRAEMQKKKLHEIPASSYNSLDVGIESYRNNGLIGADNKLVNGWEAKAEELAKKLSPEARERFLAVGQALQTNPTAQRALTANANGNLSDVRMDRQADGSFVITDSGGAVQGGFGGAKQRRAQDIKAAVSAASGQGAASPRLSGADLDTFAAQFSEPPTQAQQQALGNAFAAGAYVPGAAGFTPQAADAMGRAQSAGVSSSIAFQHDSSGKHSSPAYQAAHDAAASAALSGVGTAGQPQVDAVQFVANMDVQAVGAGGEVSGVAAKAMQGKVSQLVNAASGGNFTQTTQDQVREVMKALEKAVSQAQSRVSAGVGSADDQAMAALASELGDKQVKKFLNPKKKKSP